MTVLEGVSEGAEHHVHAGAAAVAPHEPHAQHLGAERNAQWNASIRHFTDQGARKALYNTASQSPTTFRLPANPLDLLRHMQSEQTRLAKDQSHFYPSPFPLPLQNKGEGEGVEM